MKGLLGGSHQAIYDYYESQVFAPLGMHGAVVERFAIDIQSASSRDCNRKILVCLRSALPGNRLGQIQREGHL